MAMNQEGKDRAARLLRTVAGERGMDAPRVAGLAGVDPGTVTDFWEARRWPRSPTRTAVETVLGLELGTFERAARGELADPEAIDPVELAIERSTLSRANRAKLLGYYFDMIDGQERGAAG